MVEGVAVVILPPNDEDDNEEEMASVSPPAHSLPLHTLRPRLLVEQQLEVRSTYLTRSFLRNEKSCADGIELVAC